MADKEENTLEQQGIKRLMDCRRWKDIWMLDFKECYFFCSPNRQRQISSWTKPPSQRLLDQAELYTDLAFELCGDFVTEVVNTYMPEEQNWCERGPGMFVPSQAWEKIEDQIKDDDGAIFAAIKASNLYSELQKAFFPDLAIGTCGMWIDRPQVHQAVECKAIPLRELEVNLGPNGEIDDRWAIRYTRNSYVKSLLPGITLPPEVDTEITDNFTRPTEIRWGFWRLWDRHEDEVWQRVIYVGNKLVDSGELKGEGSCPLIVPRFNPCADWPWGLGPMLQALPTFRQVDELELQRTEHGEMSLRPPISFPDDSYANVEQGLEPGMAYPIRPGSQDAIKNIYQVNPPDAANYQYEEKIHRLKKMFYVDYPEQTGDTPPTLGQWLDEMARAQRRIGTPGKPFWREGPAKIFLRFKYLLEAAGAIQPVKVDGKGVATLPRNPTQRAAEQQEIATAAQYSQMMGAMFPEEWKLQVDARKTMKNFAEKMRVMKLVEFRDEDQVAEALKQIAQLVGARHEPGATPPAAAGAPGP